MGIRAGELNKRMVIQRPSSVMNEGGEWVPGWADVAPAWVKRWAKSGTERQMARANQAEISHGVLMRPFPSLTEECRFKDGDRTFSISFINREVPGQFTLDLTELPGGEAV